MSARLFGGLSLIALFVFSVFGKLSSDEKFLQRTADNLVAICGRAKQPSVCLAHRLPKVLSRASLTDAFTMIRFVQEKDTQFAYCHDVAYRLGSVAVRKEPDTWQQVIAHCPFATCANGCLHAAVAESVKHEQGKIPLANLVKQRLATVCLGNEAWKPNTFEKSHCFMAIGSVLNYFTRADITQSLVVCDAVTEDKNFVRLCYDGVFDGLLRPMEPEDAKLVAGKAPTKERLASYCSQFVKEKNGVAKQSSCLNQAWPLFRDEVNIPAGIERFCGQHKDGDGKEACFKVLFQRVAPNNNFHMEKIASFCASVSIDKQALCLAAAVIQMLVTDKQRYGNASSICDRSANTIVRKECYDILSMYVNANEEQLFCASPSGLLKQ